MTMRFWLALLFAFLAVGTTSGQEITTNLVSRGNRHCLTTLDRDGNLQLAAYSDVQATSLITSAHIHIDLGSEEELRAVRLDPWMRGGLFGVIQTEDEEGRFRYYGLAVESAWNLNANVVELMFETSADYKFIKIENPSGDTVAISYGTGEAAELKQVNGCPIIPTTGILYDLQDAEESEIYNEMDHFDFDTGTAAPPPNLDLLAIPEDEQP